MLENDNSQIFTIFNTRNYIVIHQLGLTKLIDLGITHIHIDCFGIIIMTMAYGKVIANI